MDYQHLMQSLEMVWEERPRLDIRACRDEAYGLLDSVLQDFTDYTWVNISDQLAELIDDLEEDTVEMLIDAVVDAVAFGVDLYLGCKLAAVGKLTATGRKEAKTKVVFAALEQKDLHNQIISKYDLIPLVLRDYSVDVLDTLTDDIEILAEAPWNQVDELRQVLLASATTSFIIAALHLEDLYKPASE